MYPFMAPHLLATSPPTLSTNSVLCGKNRPASTSELCGLKRMVDALVNVRAMVRVRVT